MTLISFSFFVFILIIIAVYYTIPKRLQWVCLLIASYAFYFLTGVGVFTFLLFSTISVFFTGLLLDKVNINSDIKGNEILENDSHKKQRIINAKKKKLLILTVCILINFGILAYSKYFNFLAGNINVVFKVVSINSEIQRIDLLLPLGISFYTFQSIGYLIDVYKKKYAPERNVAKFALFVSFFPQIVQGPISRYDQLAHQLYAEKKFDLEQIKNGAQLVLWGLFKKLVIAERAAIIVNNVFDNYSDYGGYQIAIAAVLFTFQIYTDFSGGIDVAIGVSQTLGIKLTNNFRRPYFSKSISEFWQRWHITLGAWMRDYIFYPMCLSKRFNKLGKASRKLVGNTFGKIVPVSLSTLIVFTIVGIWHGADNKFVVYGLLNGTMIALGGLLDPLFKKTKGMIRIDGTEKIWRLFQIVRTFLFCTIARYFIRGQSVKVAVEMLTKTVKDFSFDAIFIRQSYILGLNMANSILLVTSILLLLTVELLQENGYHIRKLISNQKIVYRWTIYYLAILLILVFGIYGSQYGASDFIYMGY